jgi:uncharacterized membrane protein YphA (DoxX/SURF4 family)
MKRVKLFYWIATGSMCTFMILGAIIDILKTPDAIQFMSKLGYPEYFIRFIGIMKVLGIIAILIPKFPKIKEWAYAGLAFDTFGATYSHIANGDGVDKFMPALIGLILVLTSYFLYIKVNTSNQQISKTNENN